MTLLKIADAEGSAPQSDCAPIMHMTSHEFARVVTLTVKPTVVDHSS